MKKILIIGGGLSGLSSAVFLSKIGYSIEIIESTPKLGGRTYSLNYNGIAVDNGQHILMECYKNTLEYIDIIDSRDLFEFQEALSINYVNDRKELFKFKIPKYFYPLNRIIGIMTFRLLKMKDRLSVLKFLLKLKINAANNFIDLTVYEFLRQNNQSKEAISSFWESLVVSTMNTTTKTASSQIFVDMMKIIFFTDKRSANIVIPKGDLSKALIAPAAKHLKSNGVKISTSERLISVSIEDGKATQILTNKRTITDFDILISSIPEYSLRKVEFINLNQRITLSKLKYAPIVTVHVWLNSNPLEEKMYNLVGGKFDWLFNHGTHISLVKSNALELAEMNKNLVIKIVFSELKKYFTILSKSEIKSYILLKEKYATFVPDLDSIKQRKSISNLIENFYVCGDWTDTGLPATIEGAVKSGKNVTQKIISNNFN